VDILAAVRRYAKLKLAASEFVPGATPVPYSGKVLGPEDFAALFEASLDGWLTAGRCHLPFERALARQVGARDAVFVNSGSSANLVALSALTSPKLGKTRFGKRPLEPGDQVLTVAGGFPIGRCSTS
jgi:CDP-4-dehydro-6-deoxyglucose reductase, E1